MYFANPWGLLGLLAIPLILFIHLFQRRFPRLNVGGLHLWLSDEQVKTSGLRRDRMPVTKSLILELLVATLLSLLLAQPQLSNLSTTTHWVFVVDNSASMMATPTGRISFRDQAMGEMEARVDESGRNTRVTVILTGPRPTMLAGPAIPWDEARAMLAQWQPQKTQHQFQSAWDMAAQLAEANGKLVFLTDRREDFPAFPAKMELVSIGESLPNLAFETARWSIEAESLEAQLYLRVRNHAATSVQAEIVGRVEDQEIFRQDTQLPAGGSLPLSTPLPGGIKSLDLTIESNDDRLATDSRLRLIEPGLRTVKYAIALNEDHPALEPIQRFLKSAVNVQQATNIAAADFVISAFAGADTEGLSPKAWHLAVGPIQMEETARQSASVTTGPFLTDRRSPLLEGLALQGTIWSGYQGVDVPLTPIISVGKKTLFGERSDRPERSFVLDIDFSTSNFTDSPNFPILFSNLIEGCRIAKPGLRRWNFHLNELVRFELDPASVDPNRSEPFQLVHDSGNRDLPRLTSVEIPPLTRTGEYELRDGERSLGRFAVNFFDAEESDLTRLTGGVAAPSESDEVAFMVTETSPWIWMILIAIAIALAIWNWSGLRSRRKVATA